MSVAERIRSLCELNKLPISKLESNLGFSNGSLTKNNPNAMRLDRIQSIADYFLVNADYLVTESRTAICPICGFMYDPLDKSYVDLHKNHHDIYVKACESFGEIHTYLETITMPKTLKDVFTDFSYHNNRIDDFYDLCDKRLDWEFSNFIWFDVSSYAFSSEIDERKYKWEWKRYYIRENIKPTNELSLEVCNCIRRRYEVDELTPEDVIENSKNFLFNLYSNIIAEDQAEHYFKLFAQLPPERRQNIYDQIDLQTRQMEREKGESV